MNASALNAKNKIPAPEWTTPIADALERVERTIESAADSSVDIASRISSYVFAAGGKRIRPSLVLLSVGISGGSPEADEVIRMAAAAELIHTASLLHDDVIDSAVARRGVGTANSVWGNTISVLGGDFLLSKAFCLLSDIAGSELVSVLSRAAVAMTESEMLQAVCENNVESWRTEYWRIIRGKTASLMGACCESGAILSRANAEARAALRAYGENLGVAFQIADDLLDITGDPARTGKQIGSDLANGKFTLPVLLATKHEHFPKELVNGGRISLEQARELAEFIIESGAAAETRQIAKTFASQACEALEAFAPSPFKHSLQLLALSAAARDF
ncbi:MAG: polyprenyl synthetase family protein [Armatimonadota bacterium]|nr:polyprenyl synthetase family protein [Armatimonadota bacterium]